MNDKKIQRIKFNKKNPLWDCEGYAMSGVRTRDVYLTSYIYTVAPPAANDIVW